MAIKAAVFDLDGVLADSARAHYAGWKRLADELDIAFDEAANEALKGVDRMGSLEHILALGDRTLELAEKVALAERKNLYYLEAVADFSPADLLPGARALVEAARGAGLFCTVASASRNAPMLLDRLGLGGCFDFVADPAKARPKPAPDLFLACVQAVGVDPGEAIGFEDAAAGIQAIKAAGLFAVGIGDAQTLHAADLCFPTTADVDLSLAIERAGR